MNIIIIILFGVFVNVAAQLLLRFAMKGHADYVWSLSNIVKLFFSPLILLSVAIYVFSLTIWLYVLSKVEVSFAYPFLSVGFILILIFGWIFFNETINLYKVLGFIFIIIGLLFISFSTKAM